MTAMAGMMLATVAFVLADPAAANSCCGGCDDCDCGAAVTNTMAATCTGEISMADPSGVLTNTEIVTISRVGMTRLECEQAIGVCHNGEAIAPATSKDECQAGRGSFTSALEADKGSFNLPSSSSLGYQWSRQVGSEFCVAQGETVAVVDTVTVASVAGLANFEGSPGGQCSRGAYAAAEALCAKVPGATLCPASALQNGAAASDVDFCTYSTAANEFATEESFSKGSLGIWSSTGCQEGGITGHYSVNWDNAENKPVLNCRRDADVRPIRCCALATCAGWQSDCSERAGQPADPPRQSGPSSGAFGRQNDAALAKICEEQGDTWDDEERECENKSLRYVFIFVCIGAGLCIIVFALMIVYPKAFHTEEVRQVALQEIAAVQHGALVAGDMAYQRAREGTHAIYARFTDGSTHELQVVAKQPAAEPETEPAGASSKVLLPPRAAGDEEAPPAPALPDMSDIDTPPIVVAVPTTLPDGTSA